MPTSELPSEGAARALRGAAGALLLLGVFLPIGVVAAPEANSVDPIVERVRRHRKAHEPEILRQFADLLAIPNVATDDDNIRKNARRIAELFSQRGVRTEVWSLAGAPPVVFGELEGSKNDGGGPRVGIYVHYDGQPVDPAEWTNPPWRPTLYSGAIEDGGRPIELPEAGDRVDPEARLYARSSSDDKAPLAALLAALDALAASDLQPRADFVFLFEGEEEAGSTHLGAYLDRYRDRLGADLWIICDGPVHQSRRPQLVFGVRGYTGIDITLFGASRYLHSGHYGNWAPNPAEDLARLVASFEDGDGKVLIEGFYDSTVAPTEAERGALAELPDYDATLRRELGLHSTEAGNAALAERILLPSLNVRGLESARVGAEARNIIPTKATVSIDIRLVLGNRPDDILDLVEEHIRERGYHIVREDPDRETRLAHPKIAKVVRRPGYPSVRTEIGRQVVQPVIAAARRAAGEAPLLVPTLGGSLPLYLFTEKLGSPIVIAPIANHDNNQHAPDENLRLANLWYGIDLMAAILTME